MTRPISRPLLAKSVLISNEGNPPLVAVPHRTNPHAICLMQGRNTVILNAAEIDRLYSVMDESLAEARKAHAL